MKLVDFARERGIDSRTIHKYMERYPEIRNDCQKDGKSLVLGPYALRELNKVYPLPKPTIIVNGIPEEEHREVLEEVLRLQKAIITLQNELTDQKLLNAEHEANKLLLEDRQKRFEADLQEAEEKVSQLNMELEKERNKTWIQKLFKGGK